MARCAWRPRRARPDRRPAPRLTARRRQKYEPRAGPLDLCGDSGNLHRVRSHFPRALDPPHAAHVGHQRHPRHRPVRRDARVGRGRYAGPPRDGLYRRRTRRGQRLRRIRRHRPHARNVQEETGGPEVILDTRASIIAVAYILAVILLIFGLRKLSSPATARAGNMLAAAGVFLALAVTLLDRSIVSYWELALGIVVGGAIGIVA